MGETSTHTFPAWPPVVELADSVRRGERKATELLDEALERIDAGNEALNAFVHLDEGIARTAAEAVDAAVAFARASPFPPPGLAEELVYA